MRLEFANRNYSKTILGPFPIFPQSSFSNYQDLNYANVDK